MPTDSELRTALKAFRKRLKMMQLEDDSKLGHSPLTGQKSTVTAIRPPSGFGKEIWEELATKGVLKYDGGGLYMLTGKDLPNPPPTAPPANPA
jgi:hypothetical protein